MVNREIKIEVGSLEELKQVLRQMETGCPCINPRNDGSITVALQITCNPDFYGVIGRIETLANKKMD